MTSEDVVADGQPQSPDGTQNQSNPDGNLEQLNKESTEEKVAFSTYDKAMAKIRKQDDMIKQLQSEREDARVKALEEDGKAKELAEHYKGKYEEYLSKEKATDERIARTNATHALKGQAKELGCVDTEAFIKLVGTDHVEVNKDADYAVDNEQVRRLVEESKEKYSFLFQKTSPKVSDVTPGTEGKGPVTVKDASDEELLNLYKK